MTKTFNIFGSIAVFLTVFFGAQIAYGAFSVPTGPTDTYTPTFIFFNATTTSATSTNTASGGGYANIAGAKKVVMYFSRGGVIDPNIGTSTFKVQVSPDGSTWYNFGLLLSATSTLPSTVNDSTFGSTVVIGKSVTAGGNGTSTVAYALDLSKFGFYAVRCIVVENVDGEHTCTASIEK